MKLTSLSFVDQGMIPELYAFGKIDPARHIALSDNINPQLSWDEVPPSTQSFVLICHDPDVPSRGETVNQEGITVPADLPRVDFFHWVLVDIAATCREILEGEYAMGVEPRGKGGPVSINDTRQGVNNYTDWFAQDNDMRGDYFGYDGPCPPWNDEIVHRYVFTLYALDIPKLPVQGSFTGPQVLEAMAGHVLDQATLTGIYTLNPALAPKQLG